MEHDKGVGDILVWGVVEKAARIHPLCV